MHSIQSAAQSVTPQTGVQTDFVPQEFFFLKEDNVQKTMAYLEQNNPLGTVFPEKKTFFMLVLQAKARNTARYLLTYKHADLQLAAQDAHGKNALHYAAGIQDPSLLAFLVEKGAEVGQNPLSFEEAKTSALHLAAESREPHLPMILRIPLNIDVLDEYGMTPLCRATRAGLTENVERLLLAGAKTDCGTNTLPLVEAYLFKQLASAKVLLQHGANPNVTYCGRQPLLDLAAATDYSEFVALLVKYGAQTETFIDIKQANETLKKYPYYTLGMTLDEFLAQKRHLEKVGDDEGNFYLHKLVVSNPLDLPKIIPATKRSDWQKQNAFRQTPFLYACKVGSYHSVLKLYEAAKHQEIYDQNNNSGLHLMCENPEIGLAALLIKALSGCKEAKNKQGYTPLQLATLMARPDIVEVLLQNGANERVVDAQHNTLLHLISHTATTDVLAIEACIKLIATKNPALLERKNAQGDTPLHNAVRQQKNCVIHALLHMKVQIDAVNDSGQTSLVLSIACSHDITWRLVNEGACRNPKHNAPLLEACRRINVKAVECLVAMSVENSKPANLNDSSKDKQDRPLSVAVKVIVDKQLTPETLQKSDEYKIFRILVMHGADPKKKITRVGRKITIFEYAEQLKAPTAIIEELKPISPRLKRATNSSTSLRRYLPISSDTTQDSGRSTPSGTSPLSSVSPSPRPVGSDPDISGHFQELTLEGQGSSP